MKKKIKIWFIQVGEPIPTDEQGAARLLRTGMMADFCAQNNCDVVWFNSDFYHQKKVNRKGTQHSIKTTDNYEIVCLPAIPYKKNLSISRFVNHLLLYFAIKKKCSYKR